MGRIAEKTYGLSDEEVLHSIFERIEAAKIRIPDYEIINRYRAKKAQFRKRLSGKNVPQHIFAMENIMDKVIALEKRIEEYKAFQAEIQKLEAYYTNLQ